MSRVEPEKPSKDWGIIQKREKDGSLSWYARIIRADAGGRKRQYTAKAKNKTEARRLRDKLQREFDERGERGLDGGKIRFRDLADIYEDRKLVEAQYHGSGPARRKVAGLRSLQASKYYLKVLRDYFGGALIAKISHSDLEDFKAKRLKQPTRRGERSITDVNRTLELLRTMMRFAIRNGWLAKTPFELGSPVISKADEVRRERVLSFDEERRLLNACLLPRHVAYKRRGKPIVAVRTRGREYLHALIVVALDTAMRKGELLKLTWEDVDLPKRTITVTAMNSKTARARKVGMTERAENVLKTLWDEGSKKSSDLVFGIKDNVRIGFRNAIAEAGITDFRFHDLRHTAITRMVNAGLPPMEIMKVSGHTQWSTFARYVNPTDETIGQIAETLSTYNRNHLTLSRERSLE